MGRVCGVTLVSRASRMKLPPLLWEKAFCRLAGDTSNASAIEKTSTDVPQVRDG